MLVGWGTCGLPGPRPTEAPSRAHETLSLPFPPSDALAGLQWGETFITKLGGDTAYTQ